METRGTILVAIVLTALVLAAIGVGALTNKPQIAVILIAVMAGGLLCVLVLRVLRRSLRSAAGEADRPKAAAAAALGLTLIEKPDKQLLHHFADLGVIKRHGSLKHVMHGLLDDRRLLVFQHTYHIHTGQASIPIVQTVYACEAPNWPELRITPRTFWNLLALRFGYGRGLTLESAAFNRTFKLACDDEDFAITLVNPAMQEFLLDKPSARWIISGGELCLVYRGALRLDRMPASVERIRQFWSLVPVELNEWVSA